MEFLTRGSEVYVEGRQRTTRWTDRDGKERRGREVRVDELQMLRRAPRTDALAVAAKGMASVERLLRQVAAGSRKDVSLVKLAGMLGVLRTQLVGEDGGRDHVHERIAA